MKNFVTRRTRIRKCNRKWTSVVKTWFLTALAEKHLFPTLTKLACLTRFPSLLSCFGISVLINCRPQTVIRSETWDVQSQSTWNTTWADEQSWTHCEMRFCLTGGVFRSPQTVHFGSSLPAGPLHETQTTITDESRMWPSGRRKAEAWCLHAPRKMEHFYLTGQRWFRIDTDQKSGKLIIFSLSVISPMLSPK